MPLAASQDWLHKDRLPIISSSVMDKRMPPDHMLKGIDMLRIPMLVRPNSVNAEHG